MNRMKGTKIYSILTGHCPVCQSDSMYVNRNPYHIEKVLEMHERCAHCGTKYKIEPSFFFGAMYVSYAVGILFAAIVFVLSYLILDLNLTITYALMVSTLILTLPIILRISRNIWINIFMSFDKNSHVSK